MESEINEEYLETLSLSDLNELENFYDQFRAGVMYGGPTADINRRLLNERIELIQVAIRKKQTMIDARLFGSSIFIKPDDYITPKSEPSPFRR